MVIPYYCVLLLKRQAIVRYAVSEIVKEDLTPPDLPRMQQNWILLQTRQSHTVIADLNNIIFLFSGLTAKGNPSRRRARNLLREREAELKICFYQNEDSTQGRLMSSSHWLAFFSQKAPEDNFVERNATRHSPKTNENASIFLCLARFILT